jgi:hypothetical protein
MWPGGQGACPATPAQENHRKSRGAPAWTSRLELYLKHYATPTTVKVPMGPASSAKPECSPLYSSDTSRQRSPEMPRSKRSVHLANQHGARRRSLFGFGKAGLADARAAETNQRLLNRRCCIFELPSVHKPARLAPRFEGPRDDRFAPRPRAWCPGGVVGVCKLASSSSIAIGGA